MELAHVIVVFSSDKQVSAIMGSRVGMRGTGNWCFTSTVDQNKCNCCLTLLHSEQPKLEGVLAVLSAIELRPICKSLSLAAGRGILFSTCHPSFLLSIHPSFCPSILLSIHPSLCPSIYPSIHLSIHPSIHLSGAITK